MASEKRPSEERPNPAHEVTLPFVPSQSMSSKETEASKSQGSETVFERPADYPAAPVPENTLQQNEIDQKTAQEHSAAKEAPPQVPGFQLEEKLGQGTYGVVWRAREITTNKTVAIKFFHRRVGEMWQIIWAEIKQLAMLDAVPGIVQLKDAEPDGTPPYFIMNYAEGGSIAGMLRNGPLPVPKALEIFRRMTEALAYVHAKGIRHCDLKPANVLLDALGKPLIADFGQAHLSMESQTSSVNLGTFYYMAPEQADLTKQIPDTRWDVYGLGAIFYCMLTGSPPRATTNLSNELNQTTHLGSRLQRYQQGVEKAPPPTSHRKLPGMDRFLADILEKCLHLDPAKRFQNASDVMQALEQRDRYVRMRPMLWIGLVASLLLIVCLGGLAYSLVHYSVRDTQETLETQILENDRTVVRLISNVVKQELSDRKYTLERLALNKTLIEKIRAFRKELRPEQIADQGYLANKSFEELEALLFKTYRPGLRMLIYYDESGNLLVGGHPEEKLDLSPKGVAKREERKEALRKIYGKSYVYRDYYHGMGKNLPKGATPKYIGRTYVSEPYESTLEEDGKKPILVAISTPMYEPLRTPKEGETNGPPDPTKPLGILVGFIHLDELHSWLKDVEVAHGSAVLVNQHGVCVFHTGDEHANMVLKNLPQTYEAIRQASNAQEKVYRDEITQKECLASFSFMSDDKWGTAVLHYRDAVFAPINDLRWTLLRVIFVVAGICSALLACVWVWLLRTMRGKECLTG